MKTITRASAILLSALLAACGGDEVEPQPGTPADTAAAPATTAATVDSAPPAQTASGMVDPNDATRDQLLAVGGMTPAAADALIAGRPYADMRAVDAVLAAQQMDTTARATVYSTLWKPIDLNRASAEEIELIPGVGPRMRREFEEYRPYDDMARFRREMGKYVDDAEVARLERYVVIVP